jgi:hypothetical protein
MGSFRERIEEARRAQQRHNQKHDVQLELENWPKGRPLPTDKLTNCIECGEGIEECICISGPGPDCDPVD